MMMMMMMRDMTTALPRHAHNHHNNNYDKLSTNFDDRPHRKGRGFCVRRES